MASPLAATAALLLMTVSACVPVNADGDSNLLPEQPRGCTDDPTVAYGDDDVVPAPALSPDSIQLPQAPAPDAVVNADPLAIGPSSEDAEIPQADVTDSMLDLAAGIPVADDGPEAAVPEPLIALQPAASPIDAPAGVCIQHIDVLTGLVSTLPVGLASVDCVGNETSLLQCTSSRVDGEECGCPAGNFTDATFLACANSAGDCPSPPPTEGALRLRGGFRLPCDPIYTGSVEIFHLNEWGAICDRFRGFGVADVVCRQLGFPHGDNVNPSTNPPDPEPGQFGSGAPTEEAEEPQERFWLSGAS
eukprot:jgi/Ulvmu1/6017/UM260_0001.1